MGSKTTVRTLFNGLYGLFNDAQFQHATSNCPENLSVLKDQHSRRSLSWCRTLNPNDRA
jgi:hypothetical protein